MSCHRRPGWASDVSSLSSVFRGCHRLNRATRSWPSGLLELNGFLGPRDSGFSPPAPGRAETRLPGPAGPGARPVTSHHHGPSRHRQPSCDTSKSVAHAGPTQPGWQVFKPRRRPPGPARRGHGRRVPGPVGPRRDRHGGPAGRQPRPRPGRHRADSARAPPPGPSSRLTQAHSGTRA